MNARLEKMIFGDLDTTPFEPHLCRTPGCTHIVSEPWEEDGALCAHCAVDAELSDRYGRWERYFPGTSGAHSAA